MTAYDPQILQAYANKLYARANGIIATYTLLGFLVGGIGGLMVEATIRTGAGAVVAGVCALLLAILGFMMGSSRAFLLKLQAQQALCQRQIEINTRGMIGGVVPPPIS